MPQKSTPRNKRNNPPEWQNFEAGDQPVLTADDATFLSLFRAALASDPNLDRDVLGYLLIRWPALTVDDKVLVYRIAQTLHNSRKAEDDPSRPGA